MKNSTHSWDDPCDEMSFEELVENCDKYDETISIISIITY